MVDIGEMGDAVMKMLLIQFSDIHCKSSDASEYIKIDKAVDAIKTLGRHDCIVLLFTGDLTGASSKNEFVAGKRILGRLLSEIGTWSNGFIPLMIVPGNHDIQLPDGCRNIEEILSAQKSHTQEGMLEAEFTNMAGFFEYAKSKNCFTDNNLCCIKYIKIGDKRVQFCLLNSAPFSTKSNDDKQAHFLPRYVAEKLARNEDTDFYIAMMHHSYEWCEWNTKAMLKSVFEKDSDLVFFGHDHVSENIISSKDGACTLHTIVGGEFSCDPASASVFNAISVDFEKKELTEYVFEWIAGNSHVFKKSEKPIVKFSPKSCTMIPTSQYLGHLLKDPQQLSEQVTNYFVFPKLILNANEYVKKGKRQIDENDLFKELENSKIVRVSGHSSFGRTTLMKFLYHAAIEHGYSPLFVEKKNYSDANIKKMMTSLLEDQYGETPSLFDIFTQQGKDKNIVFVDDFDMIDSENARRNLLEYLVKNIGLVIISTHDGFDIDLDTVAKDALRDIDIPEVKIQPFLQETREKLVRTVCRVCGVTSEEKTTSIIGALDYMAQCQASMLSPTPASLIQYIKFFVSSNIKNEKDNQVFNLVFETNLRNSILKNASSAEAIAYLTVLEYVAHYMYFMLRSEYITHEELDICIAMYNKERTGVIAPRKFFETCVISGILSNGPNLSDIGFKDKNYFAYFVAKYLNWQVGRDSQDNEEISYVMNNICFGINDIIILFLSYIRNSPKIALSFAKKARELLDNYPELDFDKNNIPFLKDEWSVPDTLPTAKERANHAEAVESVELQRQEQTIRFRGIFDYSEADASKEKYKILRALKYTQLVARALVSHQHQLLADEINEIVSVLYELPNKFLYAVLEPFSLRYDNIIADLRRFVDTSMQGGEKITDKDLRQIFNRTCMLFSIDVLNDIAFNCSEGGTIRLMDLHKQENTNYIIQNLLMVEHAVSSNTFVSKALEVFKECGDDKFSKSLVRIIARMHIIRHPSMEHREIDRMISGKIFGAAAKKTLLLDQQKYKND